MEVVLICKTIEPTDNSTTGSINTDPTDDTKKLHRIPVESIDEPLVMPTRDATAIDDGEAETIAREDAKGPTRIDHPLSEIMPM